MIWGEGKILLDMKRINGGGLESILLKIPSE